MPIIGEFLFLAFLVYMISKLNSTAILMFYQDGMQFCLVLGSVFFMLLITGLVQDFFKAFLYGFGQVYTADKVQFVKCLVSVKTAIIAALLSGGGAAVFSVMDILSRTVTEGTDHVEYIGLFLCFAGNGFLYSIIIAIVLMPLYVRLKVKTL